MKFRLLFSQFGILLIIIIDTINVGNFYPNINQNDEILHACFSQVRFFKL